MKKPCFSSYGCETVGKTGQYDKVSIPGSERNIIHFRIADAHTSVFKHPTHSLSPSREAVFIPVYMRTSPYFNGDVSFRRCRIVT